MSKTAASNHGIEPLLAFLSFPHRVSNTRSNSRLVKDVQSCLVYQEPMRSAIIAMPLMRLLSDEEELWQERTHL